MKMEKRGNTLTQLLCAELSVQGMIFRQQSFCEGKSNYAGKDTLQVRLVEELGHQTALRIKADG